MKKILFAFFALAALAFTGCEQKDINILELDAEKFDNETEYCWQYTQTSMYGVSITSYMWASEYNLIKMLQAAAQVSQASGSEVKTSYKKVKADDAESCMDKVTEGF